MKTAVLIAVMALVTVLLRALPFMVFQKNTPRYVSYLGKVLPSAIIGMLVIYCLKDASFSEQPFGVPEMSAAICVVLLHIWKRNFLFSIISGTLVYMFLMQRVF